MTLVGDQEVAALERMPATAERNFPGAVRNTYVARKKRKTNEQVAVVRNLNFNFPADAQSSSNPNPPAPAARIETSPAETEGSSFINNITQAMAVVAPPAV